jgi:hypothetical protein
MNSIFVYTEFFEPLFMNLKSAGVELVFFEDGLIENHKYNTWIERQNKRYDEHNEVKSVVCSGCSVNEIVGCCRDKLRGMATVIPVIVKMTMKHEKLILSVSKECDVETSPLLQTCLGKQYFTNLKMLKRLPKNFTLVSVDLR